MTTDDYTNIRNTGVQQLPLRQLPPVTNDNRQTRTDNLVRLDSAKRQNIAKLPQSTHVENHSMSGTKHPDKYIDNSLLELNSSNQVVSRNLEFHIDKDSGRTVITVRDSVSKEIIRQIPSDQLLEISSRLKALQASKLDSNNQAAGILFTSKT